MEEKNLENFYLFFENKHRGSEQLIRKRLEFYEALLKCYREFSENPVSLDIGSGRGEFLEEFTKNQFNAVGIEINDNFIDIARKKGLTVIKEDALSFISRESDNKYDVISMIHVIEHLNFEYVFKLFKEVFRILKPGGCFILETPYTKNIVLGTYNFWLDPTHIRPVNVDLVRALGEYIGFSYFEYFPLQSIELERINQITLKHVFYAASPDISMVMIKDSENKELIYKLLDELNKMKSKVSVDLDDLLELYEKQIENEVAGIAELKNIIDLQRDKINEISAHLNALLNSKIWRFYGKLSKIKKTIFNNLKSLKKLYKRSAITEETFSEKNFSLNKEELTYYKRLKLFTEKWK
ncbi:MAG: class I SAM-dependent methyltransferase [Candidatus Aenigmatarchaeota archaeon]